MVQAGEVRGSKARGAEGKGRAAPSSKVPLDDQLDPEQGDDGVEEGRADPVSPRAAIERVHLPGTLSHARRRGREGVVDCPCAPNPHLDLQAAEAALTAAINTLSLGPKGARARAQPAPLKGLPQPQGTHVRFDSKGRPKHVERLGASALAVGASSSGAGGATAEQQEAVESGAAASRLELKGLPRPAGKHIRFE